MFKKQLNFMCFSRAGVLTFRNVLLVLWLQLTAIMSAMVACG